MTVTYITVYILEYNSFINLYFEKEGENETFNSQSKKNIKVKGIYKESQLNKAIKKIKI